MICPNCNAEIADNSTFCTECGVQVQATTPADTSVEETQSTADNNDRRKKLAIALCVVVGIAFMIFAFNFMQTISVRNALQSEWRTWDLEEHDYKSVVLEFDGDDIEYRFVSDYYYLNNYVIYSGKFKVVSPHKIKIDRFGYGYTTYEIDMNDGNFVIKPALTSSDSSEIWFKKS